MIARSSLILLILSIFIYTIHCRSLAEKKFNVNAREWLFRYGYKSEFNPNVPEAALADSIKVLQKYANLPMTGRLDDATLKQMTKPRCGHRDPQLKITRNRRFVLQGSTWKNTFNKKGKNELKWTLLNTGRTLDYNTVLNVMRQAFRYWEEIVNINFVEVSKSKVDTSDEYKKENIEILVSFVSGYHNDPYPFDGEGGTLAHAFYPHSNKGLSGDVHFDDAEPFTSMSAKGRNLLWVATHELGHSLGLEHSNIKEAVMYPWYTKYKPGFRLHEDDILGIQSLYGARTDTLPPSTFTTSKPTTSTTTTTTTTTTKQPSKYHKSCPRDDGSTITALFYSKLYKQIVGFTNTDKIYLFGYQRSVPVLNRGDYVSKERISGQIDAVYTTKVDGQDRQIIFSGSKYYVFDGFTYRSGPYSIHNGDGPLKLKFSEDIQKIDAAITWPRNGRTYFFSDTQYWRFDNKRKRFDRNYPKPIFGNWEGLPKKIDAGFSSLEKTFFIAGNTYYKFNDMDIKVEKEDNVKVFMECKGADLLDP